MIHWGAGCEQGVALMPMLYALGQHGPLLSLQEFLLPHEHLFAYLDDIYVVCRTAVAPSSDISRRYGGNTPASMFIWGRRQSGIVEVIFHLRVWRCKKPRIVKTHSHRPELGEVLDVRHSTGSVYWASPLATKSMFRPSSGPPQRGTALCSIGFLWSKNFKVLGCSSFSVQTHGPRIPSVGFYQQRQNTSQSQCFTQLLGISGAGETQDWASLPFQTGGCGFLASPTELRHFSAAASCRVDLRESGFDAPE